MDRATTLLGISNFCDAKPAVVADVLQALAKVLQDALRTGKNVNLFGIGTFKTVPRAARKGRNPRTGEELFIKACRKVKFLPSSNLF